MSSQIVATSHANQTIATQSPHSSRYILSALGIITLIGSFVATGCLFSYLGYASFAIGGGGVAFCVSSICLTLYCCRGTKIHQVPITHQTVSQEDRAEETENSNQSRQTDPLPPLLDLEHTAPSLLEPPFIGNVDLDRFESGSFKEKLYHLNACYPLMAIPLSFWITPDRADRSYEHRMALMEEHADEKERIDTYIENLDRAFQIKERLKDVELPFNFTVGHLLVGWKNSPARYMLLTDEELSSVTVDALSTGEVDEKLFWRFVGTRLSKLSKNLPERVGQESIHETRLVDLSTVEASHIHANPAAFPLLTCVLMNPSELKKVNMELLSNEQLHFIFSSKDMDGFCVQKLTPEQVNASIPRIPDKRLFSKLSDDQAVHFDFSQMDHALFHAVFNTWLSSDQTSKASRCLPRLDLENIYELSGYFSRKHWYHISPKHIKHLDFSRIDQRQWEDAVKRIFKLSGGSDSKAARFLPQIDLAQIYRLSGYFSADHWGYIGAEHILNFDLSRVDEKSRTGIVKAIFKTEGYKLIPQFTIEKIYQFSPYFSDTHWRCIGEKNTLALDISKIPATNRRRVFNIIFSPDEGRPSKAERYIPQLSLNQIYQLNSYFSKAHWKLINPACIHELDFSKIDKTQWKNVVNGLFCASNIARLLPQIELEWIYQFSRYFLSGHWNYIGEEHALNFDISRFENSDRKGVLKAIFNTEGSPSKAGELIPKLKVDKFSQFTPYFSHVHWAYICKEQALALDISKVRETERENVVAIVFRTRSDRSAEEWIPELSPDKMLQLCRYFSHDHLKYISDEQALTLARDILNVPKNMRKKVTRMIFGREAVFSALTPNQIEALNPYFYS